jgi:hypothetical protein
MNVTEQQIDEMLLGPWSDDLRDAIELLHHDAVAWQGPEIGESGPWAVEVSHEVRKRSNLVCVNPLGPIAERQTAYVEKTIRIVRAQSSCSEKQETTK